MGVGVAKAPPQEAARPQGPQALPGTAEQADNGPAVIATEINRAVEAFPAEGPDDRPGQGGFGLSPSPGESPDAGKSGQMLQQRHDFLGHQDVERGPRVVLAEGAQGGRH